MQVTLSIVIMQVVSVAIMQLLRFYCNYAGDTYCTVILVDLSVAIMLVTVSTTIIWVTIFIVLV